MRFVQPDTIIPDQNNPQSLNRYTYALNDPIRYTDPDGHCVFEPIEATVCGVVIVGAIIVVAVGVVYLSSPQGQHAARQAAENLVNSAERWQQNNANQRQLAYLLSVMGKTGDSSGGIPPSANNSGCKNTLAQCIVTIGVGIIFTGVLTVFCTADGEKCLSNSSPDKLKVKPTPTTTSTPATNCPPPYLHCSVLTSPTRANSTSTSTPSNTNTTSASDKSTSSNTNTTSASNTATSTPAIWHYPLWTI